MSESLSLAGLRACLLVPYYLPECLEETITAAHKMDLPLFLAPHPGLDPQQRAGLESQSNIHLLTLPGKHHKGAALEAGLQEAGRLGYDVAVSLDAAGRYLVADISRLLNAVAGQTDAIIIGADENTFDRKSPLRIFSDFWFWIETGRNIPDIRSNLKVYPVKSMNRLHIRFRGPNWEIEALARASWGGLNLKSVPVRVLPGPRIPAQPLRHLLQTLALHVYLVLRRLLPLPFRAVVDKPKVEWPKTWKERLTLIWKKYLWQPDETAGEIAVAVGFGVFTGLSPFWGWHTLIGLYFAQRLHLNKVLVVLFSYISIPPLIPIIIYSQLVAGRLLMTGDLDWHVRLSEFSLRLAHVRLKEFILGGLLLALVGGLLAGVLSFVFLRYIKPLIQRKNRGV
jgi:uncharacterized protein (DUF2062 family)